MFNGGGSFPSLYFLGKMDVFSAVDICISKILVARLNATFSSRIGTQFFAFSGHILLQQ